MIARFGLEILKLENCKNIKVKKRDFLKKISLASAAIAVGNSSDKNFESIQYMSRTKKVINPEIVNVALLGAGGMGNQDLDACLMHEGVNLIGVCDLYQ